MAEKRGLIAILNCHDDDVYCFRKELIDRLVESGYSILLSCPYGKRIPSLMGGHIIYEDIAIDRRGKNPFRDLRLLKSYISLFKKYRPIAVLSFTIKPNIYGGMAANWLSIPYIPNITGLGSSFQRGGITKNIVSLLYKGVLRNASWIFFQNEDSKDRFIHSGIVKQNRYSVIFGSGVNLKKFSYKEIPPCGDGKSGTPIKFAFVGRIMVEKGIDHYLDVAEIVKRIYPSTEFHICGFFEQEYDRYRFNMLCRARVIIYDGYVEDIGSFIGKIHCIVHPSYHEGMSNALLEAASVGRPIIASRIPGCRETFDEKISGIGFEPHSTEDLLRAIEKFIGLSNEVKASMGRAGHEKMVREFDRDIVVDNYIEEIEKVLND